MLEVTTINFYSDIVDIFMYGFSVTLFLKTLSPETCLEAMKPFSFLFSAKALSDPCYAMVTLAANNSNRI